MHKINDRRPLGKKIQYGRVVLQLQVAMSSYLEKLAAQTKFMIQCLNNHFTLAKSILCLIFLKTTGTKLLPLFYFLAFTLQTV